MGLVRHETVSDGFVTNWFVWHLRKSRKTLVHVPLMQFQCDAIVSFTFNVGVGGLKKSNFLKELNGGNYNG